MIRSSITPLEFRQNPGAVAALKGFLGTAEGEMFIQALCGAHPLTLLSEPAPASGKLRDASLVEGAADGVEKSLLGKVVGYEMCLATIASLTEDFTPPGPAPVSRSSRTAQTLRNGRDL